MLLGQRAKTVAFAMGTGGSVPPITTLPEILTSGAVTSTGAISAFSSDGPTADGRVKPELLARGVETFTIASHDTVSYNAASGTSMSTAYVQVLVFHCPRFCQETPSKSQATLLMKRSREMWSMSVM